jgi:diguanylate cyclase (GGDEF)-like protein/PAS domain S-box-containing protein
MLPAPALVLDERDLVVDANELALELLGRPRGELLGRAVAAVVACAERGGSPLRLRTLRSQQIDGTTLCLLRVASGEELVDDLVSYFEEGTAVAWMGQWQDVMAQRAIETRLRRERDLSAAMLAAMHEGLCHIDGDTVRQVNDAMCELVGWTREEIVGQSWPFPWVPQDRIEQQTLTRASWQATGHGETDTVLRHKDGRCFDASITAARATGPDGESLGYVMTIRDISERKRHEAELARQATHDTLTGLINHGGFQELLRGEIARCRRQGAPLSLAILDLDNFKHVNDTYGHPSGDRVLAELGRRFRELARAGEHIARIGGEEFAWILPATDAAGACAAAERVRQAVAREPFEGVGELTVSIGVCELAALGDVDELHRLADAALYWAKDHGRNIVCRYTPEMGAHLERRSDPKAAAVAHRLRLRAMHAIARMVEQGHPTSDRHAERIADLAAALAERLGWAPADVRALREAGVLHDIGKVIVPTSTLLKPGPFSEEEWVQMRQHPAVGDDMLEGVLSSMQRAWVRGHHERWDGRGYPDALAADDIAQGARILAVADSWDVMTSARVYSDALRFAEAVDEVGRAAGGQLDPVVAAVLLELVGDGSFTRAAG